MIKKILRKFSSILKELQNFLFSLFGSAKYWESNLVAHDVFKNSLESLDHFHWRNLQYPGYIELMGVKNHDNKTILDYGCGPGNDLVGFSTYSNPKLLIAADVSKTAISLAKKRIKLHGTVAKFINIDEKVNKIHLDNLSVDLIHSSGVLHHCYDLHKILNEFHRILKDDGKMQIMVYNYNSLWVHLYVAYYTQILSKKYSKLSLLEAFKRLTDGPHCPISKCYKPFEFVSLLSDYGFEGKLEGVSISNRELSLINHRNEALNDKALSEESKEFLQNLKFNSNGLPTYENQIAGINACYTFNKKRT